MSSAAPQYNVTLSLIELGTLIRHAVKEAVHEEFARVCAKSPPGPSRIGTRGFRDSAGAQLVLAEALAESDRYRTDPETWIARGIFTKKMKGNL